MNKRTTWGMSIAAAILLAGCAPDETAPEFYIDDVKGGVVSGIISDQTSSGININSIVAHANDPDPKGTTVRDQPFTLTGLNMNDDIFTIYAEDGSDNKNRSATLLLANKNKVFSDAITMKINQSGIDYIGDELETIITELDIQALLEDDNPGEPFYTGNGTYGFDYTIALTASQDKTEFIIERPTITMTPLSSTNDSMKLSISATFPFIQLGLYGDGTYGYLPLPNVHVTPSTNATLTGNVILTKNDDNEIIASTEDVTVILGEIDTDLTGGLFPDFDKYVGSFIKDDLEANLTVALENNISSILTETFSEIPFENNDIPVNGKIVNFSALPTELTSDSSSLALMMNSHAKAPVIDPTLKGALGSHYIDKSLTVAQNDTEFDLSTVVSANLLNQMLLAAYQSGATTFGSNAAGYNYDVTLQSPAYVELTPNNGDKIGTFTIKRMRVYLENENDENIHSTTVVDLSLTLSKDTIGVENGNLVVNLEQVTPDFKVITFNDKDGFEAAAVDVALKLLIPVFMPELTSSLNSLPLPDLAGYSINLRKTAASENKHLLLAGDMVSLAATAAATAPDTYAVLEANIQTDAATEETSTAAVTLSLSGDNPTEQPLQYRYQIDGGNWSVWTEKTEATLNNVTPGSHTAVICARTYEMKVDPSCAEVSFVK